MGLGNGFHSFRRSGKVSASDSTGDRGAASGRAVWTFLNGDDCGGELERSVENLRRFRGLESP